MGQSFSSRNVTQDLPDPKLCPTCQAIDFSRIGPDESSRKNRSLTQEFSIVLNKLPLDATQWVSPSLKLHCPLCRTFRHFSSQNQYLLRRYSHSSPWDLRAYPSLSNQGTDVCLALGPQSEHDQHSSEFLFWAFHSGSMLGVLVLTLEEPKFPSLSLDIDLLKSWIGTECRQPTDSISAMPTAATALYSLSREASLGLNSMGQLPGLRLIDCETMEIIPATGIPSWVALSYVWAIAKPDRTRPKRRGRKATSHGKPLPERVPGTILDAITLVRALGRRYLWVDQYCIDQKDPNDVKLQISLTDRIYMRAELTIVSLCRGNCLPGVENGQARVPLPRVHVGGGRWIYISGPAANSESQQSVWSSRGWTFQEEILSRRRLYTGRSLDALLNHNPRWLSPSK
jgi:hypothetical protein